jgi:hypothetical protein
LTGQIDRDRPAGYARKLGVMAQNATGSERTRLLPVGIRLLHKLREGMSEELKGARSRDRTYPAFGTAERGAGLAMIERHSPGAKRITPGGDKGFDATDFVGELRERNVTPPNFSVSCLHEAPRRADIDV